MITFSEVQSTRWLKIFSAALVVSLFCRSQIVFGDIRAEQRTPQRWLVIGTFPSKGDNSFYKDFLKPSAIEMKVHPHEGDSIVTESGIALHWKEAFSDDNGFLNAGKLMPSEKNGILYAYTALPSDKETTIAATFGFTGSLQVWLNDELVHEIRISRKPEPDKDVVALRLKKGNNAMLAKVEGTQPYWGFTFKKYRLSQNLFVNEHATVVPDFRIGDPVHAWGQVEVANVSRNSLPNVAVEILGNGFVISSQSSVETLLPGEVRRIPFWLATNAAVSDSVIEPLQLKITSGKEQRIVRLTPRARKRNEYFVTTYRSHVDGSVQPYSLLVPTSYRPDVAYPLVGLLHGAWVTDWGQNIISYDLKEWIIQVAVHDRGNNRYRDVGQTDLNEVLHEVKRNYRIDEDRIFLAGHSMGGYGTWFQATRYPDRWAAISPQAGYTDYFLYHPAMSDEKSNSEFRTKLLEEWSPLLFAENLLHVPAYIVHGAKDDNVVVEHARKMAARLRDLGYTFVFDENPDAGHWWGPRGTTYGMEVVDKPPIWSFLQLHGRRLKNPRTVLYKTNTLRYNTAYWVTVDELDTVYAMARIAAEIFNENKINIVSKNITQFTLHLNDSLVKKPFPVEVTVNGRLTFQGGLPRSSDLTLRRTKNGDYVELFKNDDLAIPSAARTGGWSVGAELDQRGRTLKFVEWQDEPLKKTRALFGPVTDAFNSKFLFIVGTSSSKHAVSEAIQKSARMIARSWEAHANGIVRVKFDTQIVPEDIAENNIILFGDEKSNTVVAQIENKLPIRFLNGKVTLGKDIYTGNDIGAVVVYPNPLNPAKYAVVIGGATPLSFELATRLNLSELPDYVVFDRHSFQGDELEYRASGFFDKYWRLTTK